MSGFDKQDFAVLNFGVATEFYDLKSDKIVELQQPAIVEVVAIKVRNEAICGHFHSFVAIEGYDAFDIEFQDGNITAYNLKAEHLIGAPSFDEVANNLKQYIGNDALIVNSLTATPLNPFYIFKKCAKKCGYRFDNQAYALGDILSASRVQQELADNGAKFENLNTLQIAKILSENKSTWAEVFCDYNIVFNPQSDDYCDKDRNDTLSWAIAFAKLFIALIDWHNITEQEVYDDKDFPF